MQNKDYYTHILPNGMKVIYLIKKGFYKKYVGIGTLYGAIDFKFMLDDKIYETKAGIAHFIEHKLFEMPGGIDAFMTLTNLGAMSNAYTAADRTVYYFSTTKDIKEPLKVLTNFVFTPYFEAKSVEREKSIIKSEIQMYLDYPDYRLETETLRNLYAHSTLENDIAGTYQSVDATTPEDLLINYQAFYNPKNLVMVIVGDYNLAEIDQYVIDLISTYPFTNHEVERLDGIPNSITIEEEKTVYESVSQNKVAYALRLDEPTNNFLEDYSYDAIISTSFSDSSQNYQEMLEMAAITNDFSYQIVTSKKYRYIMFTTETALPDLFIKEMKKRIANITKTINREDISIYLNMLYGESIAYIDNISNVGEALLQYGLYGLDFIDKVNYLPRVTYEDILPFIQKITNAKVSIVKMLKNKPI